MSLKVLHVTNHFYPCVGGIESMVNGLCKSLQKHKVTSDVLCLNKCARSATELPEFSKRDGIKIFRVPFLDLHYYKIAPFIFNYLKNYDIIHIHGIGFFSDFLLLTKPLHKKPIVVSTHGGIMHTKSILPVKNLYLSLVAKQLLPKADKIVAVSQNDKKQFSIICKNVIAIDNGTDLKKFKKSKKQPNSFIFVGRISKNKKLDNILTAFSKVVNEIPEAKLTIVGADYDGILPKLKILAKNLNLDNKVKFSGKSIKDTELLNYYSKSEFFISASEYEGFGITILEALAANCAVILNKTPSLANFIKTDLCIGINFNSPDVGTELLAAIPKARKKGKSKHRLLRKFLGEHSLQTMASKYFSVYKQIVNYSGLKP